MVTQRPTAENTLLLNQLNLRTKLIRIDIVIPIRKKAPEGNLAELTRIFAHFAKWIAERSTYGNGSLPAHTRHGDTHPPRRRNFIAKMIRFLLSCVAATWNSIGSGSGMVVCGVVCDAYGLKMIMVESLTIHFLLFPFGCWYDGCFYFPPFVIRWLCGNALPWKDNITGEKWRYK